MFQMLTGYHPFEEDCKIAVLLRIFKTLGTPSHNILEFPTLLSDSKFVSMMTNLPQWEALDLADFIISETTNINQEMIAVDLLSKLLQIEPTKRGDIKTHMNHALFDSLDKQAIIK